jgi:protein gp37
LPRIEHLCSVLAAVRFLSVEPLLEDIGTIDLTGIDWVIVGEESGPGARPMNPDWVRSLRDQCAETGVPFLFKQWGGVHKGATGRVLDGRTHDDMPGHTTVPERERVIAPVRPVRLTVWDRIMGDDDHGDAA